MRKQYSSTRMPNIEKIDHTKCQQEYKAMGFLYAAGRNIKQHHYFGDQFGSFLKITVYVQVSPLLFIQEK